jgi:hypothetical protein
MTEKPEARAAFIKAVLMRLNWLHHFLKNLKERK